MMCNESVGRSTKLNTTDALHQLAVQAIMAAYPRRIATPEDTIPDYISLRNEVFEAARDLLTLLQRVAAHPGNY